MLGLRLRLGLRLGLGLGLRLRLRLLLLLGVYRVKVEGFGLEDSGWRIRVRDPVPQHPAKKKDIPDITTATQPGLE